MAHSLTETLAEATGMAATKSEQVRRPARYLFASALAGAYVGVAVVLLIAVSALARNLLWTVPGNVLGGGLLVGLGYAWLAGPRRSVAGDAAVTTSPEPSGPIGAVTASVFDAPAAQPVVGVNGRRREGRAGG